MPRKRGFTLIELLVVIAIIAILATILFPVFLSAKSRGQQAACLSNMKQIGSAVYTYLGDWNETYPMNRFQDPAMSKGQKMDGSRYNWKTAIHPYLKSRTGVWRCPGNIFRVYNDETGKAVPGQPVQKFPISYALCGDFFNDYASDFSLPVRKVSNIPSTTRQLFIIESRFDAPDLRSGMLRWQGNPAGHVNGHDNWSWMMIHIGQMSNFLFADCHARAMKVRATLTPDSMWRPAAYRTGVWSQHEYDLTSSRLAPECYE